MIPIAHFSGVNAKRVSVVGEIAVQGIPAFIEECERDGWVRAAVSEVRILASFNEHGKWLHPDLREQS